MLRNYYIYTIGLLFSAIIFSCKGEKSGVSDDKQDPDQPTEKKVYDRWLIDLEMVESGCERLDCIRSIDEPKFIPVDKVNFISDEDLVIGVKIGDEIHCYPHNILNWHEIVNDNIEGKYIAVNYCPLTGSGMAWNRNINGKLTTFGVSGLLYNSNVMPYDRTTRSAWSQMKQLCVNGELADKHIESFPVIETTWSTWKKLYPNSKVVSTETGMQRDYLEYPYGDYRENRDIYFEVELENATLHPKERLYGVIQGDKAKCYRFDNFKNGIRILGDTVFEKPIIVVGSERENFIIAFENPENLSFKPYTKQIPAVIQDNAGNTYDLFGTCIEGPKKGTSLTAMNGFTAYWFAWYAFYPDVKFE